MSDEGVDVVGADVPEQQPGRGQLGDEGAQRVEALEGRCRPDDLQQLTISERETARPVPLAGFGLKREERVDAGEISRTGR